MDEATGTAVHSANVGWRDVPMLRLVRERLGIPVAIGHGEGADFRAPLGRAVIGGTITSTLLTLLVIPTVYEILDDFRSWVRARLGRGVRGGAGEPLPTPASSSTD